MILLIMKKFVDSTVEERTNEISLLFEIIANKEPENAKKILEIQPFISKQEGLLEIALNKNLITKELLDKINDSSIKDTFLYKILDTKTEEFNRKNELYNEEKK